MPKKAQNPYERKTKPINSIKKIIEDETKTLDPNNPFTSDFMEQNEKASADINIKKIAESFRPQEKKVTESYYLSKDIVDTINTLAKSSRNLKKSAIVEQILREYLEKKSLLKKK